MITVKGTVIRELILMLADTSVNLVVDLETSLGVFRQGRLFVQVTWGVAARKYLEYIF